MLKIVTDDVDRDDLTSSVLDELVSEGARRMLLAAAEAEVADYIDRHRELVDELGHRLVVRNGKDAERTLVTGAGELKGPGSSSSRQKGGSPVPLADSAPLSRRSPKVAEVLPVLDLRAYRQGISLPRSRSSSAPTPACRHPETREQRCRAPKHHQLP